MAAMFQGAVHQGWSPSQVCEAPAGPKRGTGRNSSGHSRGQWLHRPPPPGLKGKVSPQGQQPTFQVTFVPRAPQDPWTPGIGTQGLQAPCQGDASCRALGLPGGHPSGGLPWEATRPWAPWRGGERAASDHWVGSERKGVQGQKRGSQPEQPEGRSCRHRGQACRESQGSVRQAGAGILTWGESGLSLLPPPLRQEPRASSAGAPGAFRAAGRPPQGAQARSSGEAGRAGQGPPWAEKSGAPAQAAGDPQAHANGRGPVRKSRGPRRPVLPLWLESPEGPGVGAQEATEAVRARLRPVMWSVDQSQSARLSLVGPSEHPQMDGKRKEHAHRAPEDPRRPPWTARGHLCSHKGRNHRDSAVLWALWPGFSETQTSRQTDSEELLRQPPGHKSPGPREPGGTRD
ncbi:collagen alpha-1(I) chain-like [Marmota monax]|uniref:collagen alpha-1(I) chain-like n=1 Tax=Marmota monax TaxID=9995 RepID=UPI001EAFC57A|nr:collagen alpha-1(I) chain-like [Marmota monax]